jgi:tetratricopeptide (TPR) repeat protein
MKRLALLSLGIIFIVNLGNAQKQKPDYGTGEDSVKCLRNLSLYTEFYRQKNYTDAYQPWRTTLEICPASNKNIYIHGATMFKRIIASEKDPAVKAQYIDSLMWLYNKRIENFGQEGYVLGRKGVDLFKLNNEKFEEAYDIMNKSVELRKNKTEVNTLVYWLQTAVLKFKADEAHRETVLNNYSTAIDILDYQLKTETKPKKIKKIEDGISNLEEIFSKSEAPDCEALVSLFTPKFEESPTDVELLKKITMLLDRYECNDADLFVKASENLYNEEKSAESAYMVAKLYLKKADYDKASGYYEEAIEQQTDSMLLAKYYYELATLTHAKGNMGSTARSYAYKSIANDPTNGNPYILIGLIYAASTKECGADEFEQKAVYWLVVDQFIKAKSVDSEVAEAANKEIATYSQYFPTKEEAFFRDFHEGAIFEIGCWINKSTKVRFP